MAAISIFPVSDLSSFVINSETTDLSFKSGNIQFGSGDFKYYYYASDGKIEIDPVGGVLLGTLKPETPDISIGVSTIWNTLSNHHFDIKNITTISDASNVVRNYFVNDAKSCLLEAFVSLGACHSDIRQFMGNVFAGIPDIGRETEYIQGKIGDISFSPSTLIDISFDTWFNNNISNGYVNTACGILGRDGSGIDANDFIKYCNASGYIKQILDYPLLPFMADPSDTSENHTIIRNLYVHQKTKLLMYTIDHASLSDMIHPARPEVNLSNYISRVKQSFCPIGSVFDYTCVGGICFVYKADHYTGFIVKPTGKYHLIESLNSAIGTDKTTIDSTTSVLIYKTDGIRPIRPVILFFEPRVPESLQKETGTEALKTQKYNEADLDNSKCFIDKEAEIIAELNTTS
jgi:hypothetical protein